MLQCTKLTLMQRASQRAFALAGLLLHAPVMWIMLHDDWDPVPPGGGIRAQRTCVMSTVKTFTRWCTHRCWSLSRRPSSGSTGGFAGFSGSPGHRNPSCHHHRCPGNMQPKLQVNVSHAVLHSKNHLERCTSAPCRQSTRAQSLCRRTGSSAERPAQSFACLNA